MDLALLIVDIHPVLILLVGLLISVLAPSPIHQGIWCGILVWLYLSLTAAVLSGDLITQWFVLGQMIAWLLPGAIVAVRAVLNPGNTPYGAYTDADWGQLVIGLITLMGSVSEPDPDPPQPTGQPQGNRTHPPWQQNNQEHAIDGNDPGDGPNDADTDVFGGLDLDTDPLHDDT